MNLILGISNTFTVVNLLTHAYVRSLVLAFELHFLYPKDEGRWLLRNAGIYQTTWRNLLEDHHPKHYLLYTTVSHMRRQINMKTDSNFVITIAVARWVVAHETTGRDVGWWTLPASRPVDCLVFHRRIIPWKSVIVCHHLEATRDGIQVQHGVICISVTVVVNPDVACYSCQEVRSNFLIVDEDFHKFISYFQTSS